LNLKLAIFKFPMPNKLEYRGLRQKRGATPGKDAAVFILVLRVDWSWVKMIS